MMPAAATAEEVATGADAGAGVDAAAGAGVGIGVGDAAAVVGANALFRLTTSFICAKSAIPSAHT